MSTVLNRRCDVVDHVGSDIHGRSPVAISQRSLSKWNGGSKGLPHRDIMREVRNEMGGKVDSKGSASWQEPSPRAAEKVGPEW